VKATRSVPLSTQSEEVEPVLFCDGREETSGMGRGRRK
jgi:hypothetical protein